MADVDYQLGLINIEIADGIRDKYGDIINGQTPYDCRNRNTYQGIVDTWNAVANGKPVPTEQVIIDAIAPIEPRRSVDEIQKTALALLIRDHVVSNGKDPNSFVFNLPQAERDLAIAFLQEHSN